MVEPETAVPLELPSEPFGIVSLHRFELLNDRRLFAQALEALSASDWPLLFVDHPVTVAAVERFGLGHHFQGGLRPIPRLDFFGFVATMRRSSFLVTDSGGSQEETYYLDLPCLVHRKRTERPEGLRETAVVSGYAIDVLQSFLEDPARFRRRSEFPLQSPSDVIVEDLAARLGF
jgi:UDP-N-acetylglucosamine 2-epimerase (non-hydrolysing)